MPFLVPLITLPSNRLVPFLVAGRRGRRRRVTRVRG